MTWLLKHARHGNKPWAVQAAAQYACEASGRAKYGYWLEQGLGKTALVLNEWVRCDVPMTLQIVCPNSFKRDWELAPAEWGIKCNEYYKIRVINYEAARRGFNQFAAICKAMEATPTFLVIDESSFIKNYNTENFKSVLELCKRARYVRLLNGTPQTQSVMDWYPQLRCLGEFNGMTGTDFRARYVVRGGFMGRQIKGIREDNRAELEQIIQSCSFRALKADWRPELPPQNDIMVNLEMTRQQRVHYNEMMEEFFTNVDGLDVPAQMVLTQMDKLRQISSCIAMHKGKTKTIATDKDNSKIRAVHDIVESGQGKVIVVYTYRASGDALMDSLKKYQPASLRGQMCPSDLMGEKARFDGDSTCRVLIAQQSAACMGHTLLGGEGLDRCHRMIFYEDSFSLRDYLQMRDRNHRGEQDMPCDYYHLVTSPMDATVIGALVKKQTQAAMVDEIIKTVRNWKQ